MIPGSQRRPRNSLCSHQSANIFPHIGHQAEFLEDCYLSGEGINPRLKATLDPQCVVSKNLRKKQENVTCNQEKNQSVERDLEKKTEGVGISTQGCPNRYYKYKWKHEFTETKWKTYF